MADITLRSVKGTPLTNAEVDANFSNINTQLNNHNHDAAYLGITAKAADSELLDGFNSTAFLRSVNGTTPDSNGNVAINVDLSSRVAKAGDSMTGLLATKTNAAGGYQNANDSSFSVRGDTSNAAVMSFHRSGAYAINMGLDTDNIFKIGGWSDGQTRFQSRADGHIWTPAYGWLNDYFFRSVSNCQGQTGGINENCYGGGNIFNGARTELVDEGGNLRIRYIGTYSNCNCK